MNTPAPVQHSTIEGRKNALLKLNEKIRCLINDTYRDDDGDLVTPYSPRRVAILQMEAYEKQKVLDEFIARRESTHFCSQLSGQ